MFKSLRKALLVLSVLIVCAFAYHLLANPDNRRSLRQKAVEMKEAVAGKSTVTWSGVAVVREAIEGDTLIVSTEGQPKVRVRLAGLDAPVLVNRARKPQPLAEESRDFMADLLKDQAVQMEIIGTDCETRPLVLLSLGGSFVNSKIIGAGLAEASDEHNDRIPARQRHEIENAQLQARAKQRGIWGLTNYIRPAEYRIRYP